MVNLILKIQKQKVNILAFSIGGTIAWNFGLKTDNINSLVCVSSTRLRNETERPKGDVELYFGKNDQYKPTVEWLENMKLDYELLSGKGHQVYREPQFAEYLSEKIVKRHHSNV